MKSAVLIAALIVGFFAGALSTSAAVTVRDVSALNLAGWWTLDEGTSTIAHDFSGNNKNGTLTGFSTPTWASGKRGKSILFNGSTDYVDVGNVQGGIVNFTWTAWIKTTQNISDVNYYQAPVIIGTIQGGGDSNDANFVVNGGKLGWYDELSTGVAYDTGRFVNDGVWHHVVAIRNGTTVSFYVDGSAAGSVTTGTDPLNSNGLQIAKANWTSARFFGGNIDDVRVYSRALTAAEATNLYRAGDVTRKSVSNNGLMGWWTLDEGTSTIAHDFSGNNRNGALASMSASAWVTGKYGKALLFDGVNDSVNAGSLGAFPTRGTISYWMNPAVVENYRNPLTTNLNGLNAGIRFEEYTDGSFFGIVGNDGGTFTGHTYVGPGGLTVNKWYHITLSWDTVANTVTGYINNRLAFSEAHTLWPSTIPAFAIGNGFSVARYWSGKMDEVRLYNRVLSATEIDTLYRQGATTMNASQNNELTSGLLGNWSFNGADMSWTSSSAGIAYDSSGALRHATPVNMTQAGSPVSGRVGQALSFNGSNTYVLTPSLGTSVPSITLSAWIKSNPAGGVVFSELGQATINTGWHDSHMEVETNNVIKMCVWIGSSGCVNGSSSFTYNVWHHVVMTYNSANSLLSSYVDGVLGGTATYTKAYPGTLFYGIGATDSSNAGNGNAFSGSIDEVRIYNRAITAAEVKQLYLMGK